MTSRPTSTRAPITLNPGVPAGDVSTMKPASNRGRFRVCERLVEGPREREELIGETLRYECDGNHVVALLQLVAAVTCRLVLPT